MYVPSTSLFEIKMRAYQFHFVNNSYQATEEPGFQIYLKNELHMYNTLELP